MGTSKEAPPTADMRVLASMSKRVRKQVLRFGHVLPVHFGAAFSATDILVALYGRRLRVQPHDPNWPQRDRFILSKGHGAVALYAVLAELGFLNASEIESFGQKGNILAGHPVEAVAGVELATGSLGHGLAIAAGYALAAGLDREDWKSVVVLGDGELNEGSIWESAMFVAHHRLTNVIAVIDRNGYQQEGSTARILDTEPLADKLTAFGWDVIACDGHDHADLARALDLAWIAEDRPVAVVARTVKGKGVSFMENDPTWHMCSVDEAALARAQAELDGGRPGA